MTSLVTPDAFTNLPESSGPFSRTLMSNDFCWISGVLAVSTCPNCPRVQCPSAQVSKSLNVQVSKCPNVQAPNCPRVQVSMCPSAQVSECPSVQVQVSKCPSSFGVFQLGRVLRTPSHPQDECPKFQIFMNVIE